jgi:DNA-binding NarL/FixJ family response regulator
MEISSLPGFELPMHRRFIVVDDHPLFRTALGQVLSDTADIAEAADVEELLALLEAGPEVDLVLLDLHMPGVHGFSGLLLVRAQFPQVPVLVVSGVADGGAIRRSLELGAAGYLKKSAPVTEIRQAVEAVIAGGTWPDEGVPEPSGSAEDWQRLSKLTPQQVRVLMMLSQGLMNKQIAHELSISEATVKAHVSAILQKLDVDSRTQAVILAKSLEGAQLDALSSNTAG